MPSKTEQDRAVREAKATRGAKTSTAKKATAKKSTAKKSTAKSATAKKSTAKSATARTTAPRTKGARWSLRQVLKDATEQGVIRGYTLRGQGDDDCPSTLVLKAGDKAFPKTPAEAVTVLTEAGYSPTDGKATDAVKSLAA